MLSVDGKSSAKEDFVNGSLGVIVQEWNESVMVILWNLVVAQKVIDGIERPSYSLTYYCVQSHCWIRDGVYQEL